MPIPSLLHRLCSTARKRRATARRPHFLPRMEELEPRWVPATITVNSAGDADNRDEVLTLREAILIANGALPLLGLSAAEQAQVDATTSTGRDTIAFNIPQPGVQTIAPTTALPTLIRPIVIDGYTQPGAAPNQLAVGSDAVLLIQLDGSGAGDVNGLVVAGGNSIVQGLVINRFSGGGTSSGNAIVLPSNGNLVAGNFLGTDAAGTLALGNRVNGVLVNFASNNTIGGTTPAARNVISANLSHGIELRDSTATIVAGNYIGTDAGGTAALGNASNGVFLVNPIINPGQANNTIGGTTTGAGNVIAGNQGAGVNILTNGNAVFGNLIGTDATGMAPLGNLGPGVQINVGRNNVVGDFSASARNVIAGNLSHGVALIAGAAANTVRGNYLGLNATGTAPLGNAGAGVLLNAAAGNVIGGAGDGAGNAIAANQLSGVALTGNTTTGNRVQGNRIGTLADGVSPAGNARDGVLIAAGAANNFIGGIRFGEGNTIAFNRGNGVLVGSDPAVGQTTSAGLGNAIRGNAIFDNARLGIDLGPNDGVTPNDPGDADGGPNGLQNFPVLTAITVAGSVATIVGKFHSTPNTSFTLEFFGNMVPDPSGYGEGQRFLGTALVTTNEVGDATFSVTLEVGDPAPAVSVTATNDSTQSTSEFSRVFNTPPSGTDNTVTTLEDTAFVFSPADFGFSDVQDKPPDNFLAVAITTLPSNGTLLNNGQLVRTGDFISVVAIAAGQFQFRPGSNEQGEAYTSFAFQVQDDGGTLNGGRDLDPSANVLTIDVTSVNDAPAGADTTVTTLEDTALVFSAADFGFSDLSDAPPNNFLAVRITTLPSAGTLTNNGLLVQAGDFISVADIDAGNLTFTPAANASSSPYTGFTFQVQDAGGISNNGRDLDPTANTLTLNVRSVNDAPAGGDAIVTTLEDTNYVFVAADFGFNDPNDAPPDAFLAVRIATLPNGGALSNDGTLVQAGDFISVADIDAGRLQFTPASNANGSPYTNFTFQVQDDDGTTDGGVDLDASANTLTVNVLSVNDAPAGADDTVTTLEDTDYVFVAADFGFSDLSDVPPNNFLAVRIATLPSAGTLTNDGTMVQAGDLISIAAIDAGRFRFTPVGNANGSPYTSFTFQVQDDGGISNNGRDLDPTANTLTLNVRSVNDAPAGVDAIVTTLEDTNYVFVAADFGFNDPNDAPPNNFLAVRIASLPSAGTLTNDGTMVQAGDLISVADINAGRFRFTPVGNANGSPYTSFAFQVQDDGGIDNGGVALDASANTLSVNVASVNDPPAGADNTVTTREDNDYLFDASDFGFSDADDTPSNPLLGIRIATLPSAGTLSNNGLLVQAGDFISVAAIEAGRFRFTPVRNANGSPYTNFTFQVQDDGGTSNGGVALDASANTLTVNVLSVNDAPAGVDANVTTLEDTDYVFVAADFDFSDLSDAPANNFLAIRIATLPSAGTLTNDGTPVQAGDLIPVAAINAGRFRFTPVSNANGSPYTNFTFQVQDDGGTSNGGVALDASANTLTVNVLSVNDAPAGADNTVTTLEDTAYVFVAADFGFSDLSDAPPNNFLAVSIITLPSAGTLLNNGLLVQAGDFIRVADINAGRLQFTPASNANGSPYANFTFQVQDVGGIDNGGIALDPTANTLTLDVLSVNDAPIGADASVTTLEDTAYVFSVADFGYSDPLDTPPHAFLAVRIITLPSAGTLRLNSVRVKTGDFIPVADIDVGRFTFIPAANGNGSPYAGFTFQVQDDGGTSNNGRDLDPSANSLTLNVIGVNDAPAGANATATTLEDLDYVFGTADFGFTDARDAPPNNFFAVRIATLPSTGTLSNDGTLVQAGDFIPVADIAAGRFRFTPLSNDFGSPYTTFTFQVQDDGATGVSDSGLGLAPTANLLTLNVLSVNDPPASTDATATTAEDTAHVFDTSEFGFSDLNDAPANDFLAVQITTLPNAGTLTSNGTRVQAGDVIRFTDIAAGRFSFRPAPGAFGEPYASFTFQVQDDGQANNGGVDSDPIPNTMILNVLSVPGAPSGGNGAALLPPLPLVAPGLVGLAVGDAATLISLVRAQENRDAVADAVRLLSFKLRPEDPGVLSRFFESLEERPLRFFLLSSGAEEEPQIGGIRGKVFVDRNGNGNQEESERGLRGQLVFLDLNNNGSWDPGEPFCETDVEGRYEFSGLGLMRYTVRQNLRRLGIVQTLPQRNLPHVVQLTRQNNVVADQNFGVKIPVVVPSDTSVPDTEPEPAKEKERSPAPE